LGSLLSDEDALAGTFVGRDSRPRWPTKARPKAATSNKLAICATNVVVDLPILFVANVARVSAVRDRIVIVGPRNMMFISTASLLNIRGNTVSSIMLAN
jgi:hypothetical protein